MPQKQLPISKTTNNSSFEDLEADFYHYLRSYGGLAPKTSKDYISRMRFINSLYALDSTITSERVEEIMSLENTNRIGRKRYSTPHAMADLHSGLMKFLEFVQSGYYRQEESIRNEIEKVQNSSSLTTTEKDAIVKSRIGQGLFRQRLFNFWHGCAITSCYVPWFLMASHIKPWRDSNNQERLDVYNGLLLTPNYDKMFDKGYISFSSEGNIIVSPLLTKHDKEQLHLVDGLHLRLITPMHEKYLQYHREHCLLV